MKKIFQSKTLLVLFGILLIAILINARTFAQDISVPLDQKMDQLIDSQNRLTDALTNALTTKSSAQPTATVAPQALAATVSSTTPQICLTNYSTWPSSSKFKHDVPWSTEKMYNVNNPSLFTDLNGDGLVDYLYIYNFDSCVLFNNGSGWDIVYKCLTIQKPDYSWTYYGDCADMS